MNRFIGVTKNYVKTTLRVASKAWSTQGRITTGLRELGIKPGGILLVHSSLSALGYVPGGTRTVVESLRQALEANGTLVMPTHSWEVMEKKGCRIFDALSTPSCVGAITEAFRLMPGVKRSLHPTHSVAAIGPRAAEITAGHELCDTPCGAGTPYEKVLHEGQILFLGVTLDSNTAFHSVEAFLNLPYLLNQDSDNFTIVDQDGRSRELPVHRHQPGFLRRFKEWEPDLLKNGVLKAGQVSSARSLLLEGKPFLDYMMKAVANDPEVLLQNRQNLKAHV